jgi:polyisoprenoid-binding protein YceI
MAEKFRTCKNRSETADVLFDMSNSSDSPEPTSTPTSTWIKRGLVGAVVLVALVYGAIFFYANVLNDSPDALDSDDLSEALEPAAEPESEGEAGTEASTPESAAPTDSEPAAAPAEGLDGVWTPATASEFGYRVDEVLGGVNVTAVGRSNEIEGSLTIDGTTASVDATVQVEKIESDDERRNGQFRGRIMDVANFPTANFRTTEPIDFSSIPADGEQVTATAVGELTLKGVTLPVTLEVTAQASATGIGVLGNIPITFTDYGIDNPSNPGVSLEDEGVVEFVLVFERS